MKQSHRAGPCRCSMRVSNATATPQVTCSAANGGTLCPFIPSVDQGRLMHGCRAPRPQVHTRSRTPGVDRKGTLCSFCSSGGLKCILSLPTAANAAYAASRTTSRFQSCAIRHGNTSFKSAAGSARTAAALGASFSDVQRGVWHPVCRLQHLQSSLNSHWQHLHIAEVNGCDQTMPVNNTPTLWCALTGDGRRRRQAAPDLKAPRGLHPLPSARPRSGTPARRMQVVL